MASREPLGTTGGAASVSPDFTPHDSYWRTQFSSRPYAKGDRSYEYYQPGYRYGFESAHRYRGRQWNEVENDMRSGWDKYEHRGQSTWENIKDAVRDAWDRVTGDDKSDTHRTTSR
jgi:hypothetical protein